MGQAASSLPVVLGEADLKNGVEEELGLCLYYQTYPTAPPDATGKAADPRLHLLPEACCVVPATLSPIEKFCGEALFVKTDKPLVKGQRSAIERKENIADGVQVIVRMLPKDISALAGSDGPTTGDALINVTQQKTPVEDWEEDSHITLQDYLAELTSGEESTDYQPFDPVTPSSRSLAIQSFKSTKQALQFFLTTMQTEVKYRPVQPSSGHSHYHSGGLPVTNRQLSSSNNHAPPYRHHNYNYYHYHQWYHQNGLTPSSFSSPTPSGSSSSSSVPLTSASSSGSVPTSASASISSSSGALPHSSSASSFPLSSSTRRSQKQLRCLPSFRRYSCPSSSTSSLSPYSSSSSLFLREEGDDDEDGETSYSAVPAILHPNLLPILKVVERENSFYVISDYVPFTVCGLLRFSKRVLRGKHRRLFIIYQLVRTLAYCHKNGIAHGALHPLHMRLTPSLWLQLGGFAYPYYPPERPIDNHSVPRLRDTIAHRWMAGEMSNFDYLMALNILSGRRIGDPNYHPVLPWIIDFSQPVLTTSNTSQDSPYTWRDLTRSKFRLTKGDEQLDTTFRSCSPHHITEMLSEVSYYLYLARRTPVPVLKRFVRASYVPEEYPASLQHLYHSTPDECIPEFYSDPSIFISTNPGMSDLQLPSWASSPEDFIQKHREALESELISRSLHHWIDLAFGYKLSGDAGVRSKNVALMNHASPRNHGFTQLFTVPHPAKKISLSSSTSSNDTEHVWPPSPQMDSPNATLYECELELSFFSQFQQLFPCYRPYSPASSSNVTNETLEQSLKRVKAEDMFAVGCILAELYLEQPLFTPDSMLNYFSSNADLSPLLQKLPPGVAHAVSKMVSRNETDRLTAQELLACTEDQSCISNQPLFPAYFAELYAFLAKFYAIDSWETRLDFTLDKLKLLLERIPAEGIHVLLPSLLPFFDDKATQRHSICLFYHLGKHINSENARILLLRPLKKLYQQQGDSEHEVALQAEVLKLHFVQQVIRIFSPDCFFSDILPFIIDALRFKQPSLPVVASKTLVQLVIELEPAIAIRYVLSPLLEQLGKPSSNHEILVSALAEMATHLGEAAVVHHYIPAMRPLFERHFQKVPPHPSSSSDAKLSAALLNLIEELLESDVITPSVALRDLIMADPPVQVLLLRPLLPTCLTQPPPYVPILGRILYKIATLIGPEPTRKHLSGPLVLFFTNYGSMFINEMGQHVSGTTTTLTPPLTTPDPRKVSPRSKRHTGQHLSGRHRLLGTLYSQQVAITLAEIYSRFNQLLPMSSLLGDNPLMEDIFEYLAQQNNSSSKETLPAGLSVQPTPPSNSLLAGGQTLSLIMDDEEVARPHHGSSSAQPTFSSSKSTHHHHSTFSAKSVQNALLPLVKRGRQMRSRSMQKDNQIPNGKTSSTPSSNNNTPLKRRSHHQALTSSDDRVDNSLKGRHSITQTNSWLEELPSGSGRADGLWTFHGEAVTTFHAHSAAVHSITTHSSENAFLTTSRDSTVKCWSMLNAQCVQTYKGHSHATRSACFVGGGDMVASLCDSSVQVWGLEDGSRLLQFDAANLISKKHHSSQHTPIGGSTSSSSTSATGFVSLCPVYDGNGVLTATLNDKLWMLDLRCGMKTCEWNIHASSSAASSASPSSSSSSSKEHRHRTIRSLCVSNNNNKTMESWAAVGSTAGKITLLDLRTGLVLARWKAHEEGSIVSSLHSLNSHLLASMAVSSSSSSGERSICIWDVSSCSSYSSSSYGTPTLVRSFSIGPFSTSSGSSLASAFSSSSSSSSSSTSSSSSSSSSTPSSSISSANPFSSSTSSSAAFLLHASNGFAVFSQSNRNERNGDPDLDAFPGFGSMVDFNNSSKDKRAQEEHLPEALFFAANGNHVCVASLQDEYFSDKGETTTMQRVRLESSKPSSITNSPNLNGTNHSSSSSSSAASHSSSSAASAASSSSSSSGAASKPANPKGGAITSLATLPLHQILAVGFEDGSISICF
ncbi:Inactive serine/threonine-protein kinase lvsG [Balamuthia mandrillaris]